MLKCLQIMCAKYYELRYVFSLKKLHSSKLACLLDTASKFALFSMSGLKDKKLTTKQTYTKTETCKLYSRVFWIFLLNFIKIDRYNFELYRFKVCAFFWDTVYNKYCCGSFVKCKKIQWTHMISRPNTEVLRRGDMDRELMRTFIAR